MLHKYSKSFPLFRKKLNFLLLLALTFSFISKSNAQFSPGNNANSNSMNLFQQTDSLNKSDSLNKGWKEVEAKIYFTNLASEIHQVPDTLLDHFQNFRPANPWWGVDLGNYGTAVRSSLFYPLNASPGLSSGYHVYDLYKISLDSLPFYNTTHPYSDFSFILGSKSQQMVDLLHTQNINPWWNFAANIKANSSQGFFSGQTAKNFSGSLNTNYASKSQRYQLKAALLYNRFSQDENGGILSDSFLSLANFNDRSRIPTHIPTLSVGRDKSAVNNILSDFDFFVQNNYSWGKIDSTYNKDSTKQTVTFIPRFRLQYDFQLHIEKHQYNDYLPDSSRYAVIAPISFGIRDTLKGRQKWNFVSNKFSLNGFIGKTDHLMHLQAGIGNRIDYFATLEPSGYLKNNSFNTFLFGSISKEAFADNQWHYDADAQLYLTGSALGDFNLNLNLGKQISDWAGFSLGFYQSLTEAPQSYQLLATNYFSLQEDLGKMSTTRFLAEIEVPELKLNIYGNYYLLTNYLYYDNNFQAQQAASPFSVFQIYGNKRITFWKFTLDNIIAWQESAERSPVHLPRFLFQEQLAFQSDLFQQALRIRTGIDINYATSYYPYAYSPYLNQFFIQNQYKTNNLPQVNIFFNFALHHFRAFLSLEELQQLVSRNNVMTPGYPSENMVFRFGFKWILIN